MRLEPWLLLLLARDDLHGYELLARLERLRGAPAADAGNVYRTLRRLEQQGAVASTWEEGVRAGPARRIYTLTADGRGALAAWADHVEAAQRSLAAFLDRYREDEQG